MDAFITEFWSNLKIFKMIQWICDHFDTFDLLVIVIVGLITAYFFLQNSKNEITKTSQIAAKVTSTVTTIKSSSSNVSAIAKMRSEGRQVLLLFGSQTGTAEELAGRLAKDLQAYGQKVLILDPEEVQAEEFGEIAQIRNMLLVLCMATYGEGDPTDNALQFYEYLKETTVDLSGLRYAVFGLGNKTYEHFNAMGKFFDCRLEVLGAKRVCELGLGDDDGNLEEDFMRWREVFLPAVQESFGWEISEDAGSQRQYRFEIVENAGPKIFTGEFGKLGAYEKQRPPFDQKNPLFGTVVVSRELHTPESDRSCLHIEISIGDTRVRYEAGDHLGVFPSNDAELVKKLGKLLHVNMDQTFRLVSVDEDSAKRHPFPCPCTMWTAFTYYVDICAPVRSHILKAIAEFAENSEEKERLILLSTASEKGLAEYSQFIQKERRSIIDVLEHFPSCKPPADYLLELLPRLQARYYSISSSPKFSPTTISITVAITRYYIGERLIKGVCTNFLSDKKIGDRIPVFVRRSTMRLPHKHITPVIMIGPGTGCAPFRGFLQERKWQKEQGKETGPMVLYFGCRNPNHDFIYEDELKTYVAEGIITELNLAFSRITDKKIYVQHKLWENRRKIWKFLEEGAHIYVCGDARNMARDVQNTLMKIYIEVGGKDPTSASKYQKEMEKQRRYQADVWS